jgi:hypothetical protein
LVNDTTEGRRLASDPAGWRRWGPYLAERAWGTVREDYSADQDAWRSFPHDHARSRAYRWNEDGLGGICDLRQNLCFAWAFWNGRDPILKERIFGLDGHQGNHGEDAKEYWWFVDSTPSHSYMAWRYLYPQAPFPYDLLVDTARSKTDPEFELIDTGAFDHGHWDISVEYAKHDTDDVGITLTARNVGALEATLHVLPTLWFRNTWSWAPGLDKPTMTSGDGALIADHDVLGRMVLAGAGGSTTLICENETNTERLYGVPGPAAPKDGIGDHVIHGSSTVSDRGTKGALWFQFDVAPGETASLELRLSPDGALPDARIFDQRRREADDFYAAMTPPGCSAEEASVMRKAFAGLLWCKQWYHYDVEQWIDGDQGLPAPPASRLTGRNHDWRHLNNADILSMPDTWEYPWYAAWDLAFHCVSIAHVDPAFAKHQLLLLLREWYMHPNGQLPAYEWAFSDVNPPVHAWAALRVFEIDGARDFEFLERTMHKLLINFTWWVNQKDSEGNNVFEGGFLGLDNIGPIDRSSLPPGILLEQADATAWMAMYCLDLLQMALVLADHDATYEDVATKFFEHFAYVADAMNTQGLWDADAGFYHDVLRSDRDVLPLEVRSLVGLIPLFAVTSLDRRIRSKLSDFATRVDWFLTNKPRYHDVVGHIRMRGDETDLLASILSPERLRVVLSAMLDEGEFLSPFGIRSLSARYRDDPYRLAIDGVEATVGYEPAESTSGLFGGNSNWRGPVWFPVNFLIIESLRRFARYFGDDERVELPTGSGNLRTLEQVAEDLSTRLISLFLPDTSSKRPALARDRGYELIDGPGAPIPFFEYFHGDSGAGLGASHQTGWTALVANLIIDRGRV